MPLPIQYLSVILPFVEKQSEILLIVITESVFDADQVNLYKSLLTFENKQDKQPNDMKSNKPYISHTDKRE